MRGHVEQPRQSLGGCARRGGAAARQAGRRVDTQAEGVARAAGRVWRRGDQDLWRQPHVRPEACGWRRGATPSELAGGSPVGL